MIPDQTVFHTEVVRDEKYYFPGFGSESSEMERQRDSVETEMEMRSKGENSHRKEVVEREKNNDFQDSYFRDSVVSVTVCTVDCTVNSV